MSECLRTAMRTSPNPRLLDERWKALLDYLPRPQAGGHVLPPVIRTVLKIRNDPDRPETLVYKVNGQIEAAEVVTRRLAQLEACLGYEIEDDGPSPTTASTQAASPRELAAPATQAASQAATQPQPTTEPATQPQIQATQPAPKKKKTSGGTKTIVGTGKGAHQVDTVAHWFLQVADESCVLPEILHVFRKLRRFVELLASPVFTESLLAELKSLSQSIYRGYDEFTYKHQIRMPPNWRRFMAIPDLIAFAGPPVNSNVRSFESLHTLMRSLHEAASNIKTEAQVLRWLCRRFLFLTKPFRAYLASGEVVDLTRQQSPHDYKFESKSRLPAEIERRIRCMYEPTHGLADRFSDLTDTAELKLQLYDGIRAGGFTIRVHSAKAKQTHSAFLVQAANSGSLHVVVPSGFVKVTLPSARTSEDGFVWGTRYDFPTPLSLPGLFSPESELLHIVKAVPQPFVAPIRHLESGRPAANLEAAFDLLFWVSFSPPCFFFPHKTYD